jgi:hypothetical protein
MIDSRNRSYQINPYHWHRITFQSISIVASRIQILDVALDSIKHGCTSKFKHCCNNIIIG